MKLSQGNRGHVVENIVENWFLENGWYVFRSHTPNSPCDLVVIKDNQIKRIDCTTGRVNGADNIEHNKRPLVSYVPVRCDHIAVYANGYIHFDPPLNEPDLSSRSDLKEPALDQSFCQLVVTKQSDSSPGYHNNGRGSIVFDKRFGSIGRIKRATGTNIPVVASRMMAILDAAYECGFHHIITSIRDGDFTLLEMYDRYRHIFPSDN